MRLFNLLPGKFCIALHPLYKQISSRAKQILGTNNRHKSLFILNHALVIDQNIPFKHVNKKSNKRGINIKNKNYKKKIWLRH